jgi:hypothetical protein
VNSKIDEKSRGVLVKRGMDSLTSTTNNESYNHVYFDFIDSFYIRQLVLTAYEYLSVFQTGRYFINNI